ncbi:hypothetical protein EDD16DRAFT_1700848 [Pisolithus croceorrhizus]|nr:hypothetical protein EDD16DRAFT_1700848 [Pisolithus croceorrhizus]
MSLRASPLHHLTHHGFRYMTFLRNTIRAKARLHKDVDGSLPKQERKAKGKGRSMDLGLGLAWAPSRVREEAIIPGLFDVTKAFESILSATDFEAFKKYVRRYDAHVISFDGPNGLLTRVEKLLLNTGVSERERKRPLGRIRVLCGKSR